MKRITIKFALRKNVFERLENSDKNQLKSVVNAFWMPNTHSSSSSTHNDLKDEFMKFPVVIKCQASTSAKTEILKEFAEAFNVDEIILPRYIPLVILKNAYETLKLSPRARSRIIKVARTIADMDQSININTKHILEAISYRQT